MVVGGPVMIHADGGVMFSLADVVINMPSPPYEDSDRDDDICKLMITSNMPNVGDRVLCVGQHMWFD